MFFNWEKDETVLRIFNFLNLEANQNLKQKKIGGGDRWERISVYFFPTIFFHDVCFKPQEFYVKTRKC